VEILNSRVEVFWGVGTGKRNTLETQVSSAKRMSDIPVHTKAEN
jgi:hypothetical protein